MTTHLRRASRLAAVTLAASLLAAAPLVGCSHTARTPATSPGAPTSLSTRVMPYRKRAALMPRGMPEQIPVIDGSVVGTSAPVSDASWLYTLETTGTPTAVADWYSRAYANADWRRMSVSDDGNGGVQMRFTKVAAETLLHVSKAANGRCTVNASNGLGQPAPVTY
jgi:hypothetical protein